MNKENIQENTIDFSAHIYDSPHFDAWRYAVKTSPDFPGVVILSYEEFNEKYDYSSITDMSHLFEYDERTDDFKYQIFKTMTSIPPLNTSNVTMMNGMFNGCINLKEIPMMDTSKVTRMNYMFFFFYIQLS